jgi:uncharacterized protein (TIGR03067 family)
MRWLISAMTGALLIFALPAQAAPKAVQGTWIAVAAEREGKAADDVVGHRLALAGNAFKLRSKDGKLISAGRLRTDPKAQPASIDFEHTEGTLKGQAWKGIYVLAGDTLKICDNAGNVDKDRPTTFEATTGSGYVLVTFRRAKP